MDSVGNQIVLWACYGNNKPWIAKTFISVHCGWVWQYASEYDANTTLWCGTFEARP